MNRFDKIIDRRGTGAIKYEGIPQPYRGIKDIVPLWVADMDFETPKFIRRALKKRLSHPVYGYSAMPEDYFPTISSWIKRLYGWKVSADDIRYIPGIVKGIGLVLKTFLHPGDKVIVQPPVYHPFFNVPRDNGFEVVENPLIPVHSDGPGLPEDSLTVNRSKKLVGYKMNLDQLEEIIDESTKVLVIANPHNPVGICWDEDTLKRLAAITVAKGVLVISDEIHAEMVHAPHRHIPYASVSVEAAANSITFMAPSKTFNIAGIVSSYAIVQNPNLRKKFFGFLEANELCWPPIFSAVATMAAYKKGWRWRRKMLSYVEDNISFVGKYIEDNIPSMRCVVPEASFMIWLDCRQLGMTHDALVDFFATKAGVYMNDGNMFGTGGDGFMRLNVACPKKILEQVMARIATAVNALQR